MRFALARARCAGYCRGVESIKELRTLISRHAGTDTVTLAAHGIRVASFDGPTELGHCVLEPLLAVVAQGAKRTQLCDKVFEYGAGQYAVVSVDLPISGYISQASPEFPFLSTAITLKPASIATLLLETAASELPAAELAGLGVSDAPAELLEAVVRLLRLLDRPRDAAALAPMVEREILWWLLNGEQGTAVRQIGLADSRLSQISRAIRWIRLHYA
ncbi:MAG: AraC family transcriptional regulator, partial [Chitinophagaceae bacterium]|nr:AraC family transcriptional regulator [Rubrivivax sp.]